MTNLNLAPEQWERLVNSILQTKSSNKKIDKQTVDNKEENVPSKTGVESYVPHSSYVNSFLTDVCQLTMAYAYFVNGTHNLQATFDLFFRKCPFNGEFAIFAGLDDALRYLNIFSFTEKQIDQLQTRFPDWDAKF
ncbi:nicotinate phosphoribosyltransferase [Reticulomyxa filosa]|uniref:Nicotinate phosphoribosyltransferase n=1 Tax=Reticulomyxa filosa TaxID=46433 RepID=X6PDH4_RETFI|nr:nicotinate phosphoribosyltransferase [Reticulomyxa filosa]|eukprot:ETO36158.1 nicotinate phosphoribosyltransferase [Reticulomyxa filosa]